MVSQSWSLAGDKRDLAALLAVEAYRLAPSPETEAALFATFTVAPGFRRTVHLSAQGDVGALLPGGDVIALVDGRASVHLVDLATGAEEAVLGPLREGPGASFTAVSPDGRFLAVTSIAVGPDDRPYPEGPQEPGELHDQLAVWDLDTRQLHFPPIGLPFHPGSVAFSPDGALIVVSGGYQGNAHVVAAATGALQSVVPPLPRPEDAGLIGTTAAVAFGPDGTLLIGSQGGPIRFVDPLTGTEQRRIDGPAQTSEYLLRVSTSGQWLATSGINGRMAYDLASGAPLWARPHAGSCEGLAVVEGIGAVLCSDGSGRVRAIDLATGIEDGRRFDSHQGIVTDLLITPDQATLVEVTPNGYVVWKLDGSGPVARKIPVPIGVQILGYMGTEAVLVTAVDQRGAAVGPVRTIDARTGEVLDLLDATTAVTLADQSRIAAVFTDGTVGEYDLDAAARIGPGVDPGFVPEGIGATPTGVLVWAGGRLQALDLAAGTTGTPALDEETNIVSALTIEPDRLFTLHFAGFETQLLRRHATSGEVTVESPVAVVSMDTAADRIIANTLDGRVVGLDPDTLEVVSAPFPGVNGQAHSLDLSADGRRLAVAGPDNALRLYDVGSRTMYGTEITGPAAAALRDDGLEVAALSDDGIAIWDLDPTHWISAACEPAGRNLTSVEWEQYVGNLAPYERTCPAFPSGR